jgi:hypothetical protein
MKRFALVLAAMLCCASADAAPPSVPPELVTWWDDWHTNPATPYTMTFPMHRRIATGKIVFDSHVPYMGQCRNELAIIRDNPATPPAVRRQCDTILGHFQMWPRRTGVIIDVP